MYPSCSFLHLFTEGALHEPGLQLHPSFFRQREPSPFARGSSLMYFFIHRGRDQERAPAEGREEDDLHRRVPGLPRCRCCNSDPGE